MLAEESLNLLVAYTEWFLAGHFLPAKSPKAAMGLVAYILWMLPSLFSVVSIGALAVVARMVGAGQRREAARMTRQARWLGCAGRRDWHGAGRPLGQCASWRRCSFAGMPPQLATGYIRILTFGNSFCDAGASRHGLLSAARATR